MKNLTLVRTGLTTDQNRANVTTMFAPLEHRFTTANARDMAARSAQVRRERSQRLNELAEAGRKATPQTERLAQQLDRLEQMMNKTRDADRLNKLSAAFDRVFRAWQVLTGTPNPGALKARGKDRPAAQDAQPREPAPA